MIGQRLLHYEIVEKLGEGGMGVVYKAKDIHLDRFVAIKVLPPEKVADPGRKARFVQEAKAASALNHPNIVHVYDISTDGGTDFIAMEYVAGKTLDQLIPRKGMRLAESLKLAVQIADALTKAHAAGIVHRDLKPGNIMITGDGLVKVLDFGLAKLTEATVEEDEATRTVKPRTEEGTVVGTAAYMSPEQAEGKTVDARSDIFSFGSVLYEMVTGARAFRGDSRMSTLAAVLGKEPPPLAAGTPHDLARLITRCLRKQPERRFQTMADLKVSLEEIREESDSGGLSAVAVPRRTRRWVWGVAVMVAVSVTVLGLWYLFRRPQTPAAPLRATPLTAHGGSEINPSFSPDGNQVAFAWNGEKQDNFDIYVKLIGPGAPLRLTTDPAADRNPAWSPDGRRIAFLRYSAPGKAVVLLIPALGGPERKIGEVRIVINVPSESFLCWTNDGQGLVVSDDARGEEPAGLFLLSVDTGERRRLTTGSSMAPALSLDGRRLAFIAGTEMSSLDLYLLDLSGDLRPQGAPRRLTFLNEQVASPAWTPDGREILFSTGAHFAQRSLWRIAPSPASSPRREPLGEDCGALAVSRVGRRLAYTRQLLDSDIWRVALRSRTEVAGPPEKFITSTRIDANPAYSPDGKRILFNSHRSGAEEVWIADADGTNPLPLTSAGGPMVADPRWSPDGQSFVVHSLLGGVRGIDVFSSNGGAPRRVAEGGAWPTWSRDGRWIYFGRDGQIWRVLSSGGEATQVTREGGRGSAFESADGKFLYYAGRSGIWKLPLAGGPETRVIGERLSYGQNLAVVEDGLYFIASSGLPQLGALYFFDFTAGSLTPLLTIERWYLGLTVSPDRRSILYCQMEQHNASLMLVENFR